jgi:stage II sporulation protein D
VGLCQHGAMGMAREGKQAQEILAHYYQGATLERLW